MIKKVKSSLFAKVFGITIFSLLFTGFLVFAILALLMPKTYSQQLNNDLDIKVKAFVTELKQSSFADSGKLFDRFIYENNIFSIELYSDKGELLSLPTMQQKEFSQSVEGFDSAQPTLSAAYHFSFLDKAEKYSLVVYGKAEQIHQLQQSFLQIFPIILIIIIIITFLISLLFTHIITYPILKVCKIANKMSDMELDWQFEEQNTDELGTLKKSLNILAKNLQKTLTDLQEANVKLATDIAHEKALEQAQLDFFSAVSHELKTPITIIKGQTEGMLLNIGDYKNRDKFLFRSLEIINTMENMVQEILTIAYIKSSKISINKENIAFSDIIIEECKLFEDIIINKDINYIQNISQNLQIQGDKKLIQKVINNLISNAISYSPKNCTITLTALSENENVLFSIENTGVHIPENKIPKLFDAFYRIEQSRNRQTGGSGLGLYIVKTILDEHNALYGIKNTEKGVLFYIKFILSTY